MNDEDVTITAESFESDDARRLITALDAGLAELYPPEQRFGPNLRPEHLGDGQGAFLVARAAGHAIGCGAVRRLDPSTAELKRMYVDPGHRGKGVGRALLRSLQAAAREQGHQRLVLETGIHQEAALALYRKAGFIQVDCWGEYASAPTSVCFAMRL